MKAIAAPAALGFALLPEWPAVAQQYADPGSRQQQAQAGFQKARGACVEGRGDTVK